MKPEAYATALYKLEKSGTQPDTLVAGLVQSLKCRGALGLLPSILASYQKLVARAAQSAPVLTVARDADVDDAKQESGAPKDVTVQIDERLIGGYRLERAGKLTDASFKGYLLELYRKAKNG